MTAPAELMYDKQKKNWYADRYMIYKRKLVEGPNALPPPTTHKKEKEADSFKGYRNLFDTTSLKCD